jgi:DNA-directed RNA polymerases I, II, and III subunit RPABC2
MCGTQGEEAVEILPQGEADLAGANKTRITTRFLTKYERARILGTRALQIRCVGRSGSG